MKSLPLADLEVVGMVYVFKTDDHVSGECDITDCDFEVLNGALRDAATWQNFEGKCDCCGKRLKYNCEVVHVPSKTGYYIGRQCASKIQCLQRFGYAIDNASVAVAERAKCSANERAFLVAFPGASVIIAWSRSPSAHKIAVDMLAKLRRWGNLSEAQVNFWFRLHAQHLEKIELAKTVSLPTGRVTFQGKIVSLKDTPIPARYGGEIHSWKMVVDLGNGTKVWGTCPAALAPQEAYRSGPSENAANEAAVGKTVRLTATVTVSDRDPLFGFFSRPTNAALL